MRFPGKLAICLPGILLIIVAVSLKPARVSDFPAFYRAANLVHSTAGLYSDSGGNTIDTYLPFLRLPSYAWMLRPLHWFSYQGAYRIWTGSLILAFGAFLWLARQEGNGVALAVCYSFPVAFSLVLGQDIAFIVLIAMAAVRLHSANRKFAAGIVASLLIVKVTYLFPVALVFLAQSRRGFRGLALGTMAQLALCFAVEGLSWPLKFIAVARSPLIDPELRRMLGVRSLGAVLPAPYGALFSALAAAILVAWLWFLIRRLPFTDAMKVALPLGLIAFPHSYIYDAVVFVPLFASVASLRTWAGRLALFGLTPIPYILLLGNSPVGVFVASASFIAAVIFAAFDIYRTHPIPSSDVSIRLKHWFIRLKRGSVLPVSPAM